MTEIEALRAALEPCPFCGSSKNVGIDKLGQSNFDVTCWDCQAGITISFGPEAGSQKAAIAAWNRRARPAPDQDAEFELWQDDMVVASSSGPREQAERDIGHYALMYGQDGPVQIFEVRRIPVATAIRAGISGEGE